MGEFIYWLEILFMLFGILLACQVFTNAIENLGDKLNLNHEFTGSILAAVGTALPETILPLVAIYMASQAGSDFAKNDIAIGAIIGAPFMLATLAMLLLGISIFVHRKQRQKIFSKNNSGTDAERFSDQLKVNLNHAARDLSFFLVIFSIAVGSTFLSSEYVIQGLNYLCSTKTGFQLLSMLSLQDLTMIPNRCFDNVSFTLKLLSACVIVALYVIYLIKTYKASAQEIGDEEEDTPELYITKFLPLKKATMSLVITQTLIGLAGIVYFAHHFVDSVEHISNMINMSPLILSMIVSPIATELPEKVNSWLWSSEGKDTLAMGNLTGAMVFQSAIPCLVGILLTPWELNSQVFISASLSLLAASILLIKIKATNRIGFKTLMLSGSLYLVYLYLIFC